MKPARGFSLVELIISLFAASLLITLLMQQYLLAKRQYTRMSTQFAQSLELQLVSDLIRNSVRSAGFTPCTGIGRLHSLDRRNGKTNLLAVETNLGKEKRLRINKMAPHFTTLVRQLGPKQLLIKDNIHYEANQVIIIADCYHAEIQDLIKSRKTSFGTVITLNHPLAFSYLAPIYLGEWIEEEFFMKKNQLFYKNKRADVLSSLFNSFSVSLQAGSHLEVKLGLEKMQNLVIKSKVRAG